MSPILFALEENEGCCVKTLAERTQRSTPTLSNTLKRMKAKGLIQTKPDKEDKRSVCISMTAKSKKLLPRPLYGATGLKNGNYLIATGGAIALSNLIKIKRLSGKLRRKFMVQIKI